jgi:nicotinamide mononucleotide transporter
MVARRVLDNWVYWLVIDSVSIVLYLERALFFTACLFAIYIIMIFFGWRSWTLAYRAHTCQNASSPRHQTT